MEPIRVLNGISSILEVYDKKIIIKQKKGLIAFFVKGLKGDKEIPYKSITAIQFKPVTNFTSGYLQFTLLGGNESRGGVFSAANDENTVMYSNKKINDLAIQIKTFIEDKINSTESKTSGDLVEEIEKLSSLKEKGILTEEEFFDAKKKLLK